MQWVLTITKQYQDVPARGIPVYDASGIRLRSMSYLVVFASSMQ